MTHGGKEPSAVAADLLNQGRLVDAESAYRELLKLAPDFAEAYFKLGNILSTTGRTLEAIDCYQQAITLDPAYVKALYNLGNALKRLSRFHEAEHAYRQALEADENYEPALHNLGILLLDTGSHVESEKLLRAALSLEPRDVLTLCNLGLALQSQGKLIEAETYYLAAMRLDPECAQAHNNLGTLRKVQGRFDEADACYRMALNSDANYPEALNNLAVILKEKGRFDLALEYYRAALAARPNNWTAHSNMLLAMLSDVDGSLDRQFEQACLFGQQLDATATPMSRVMYQERSAPLRVGLVSGDFRDHSVGHFIEGWLPYIDTDRIQLIAYPSHYAEDQLTDRIRSHFSSWHPIHRLSDQQAAALIREDEIHVLMDLSGHTAYNRLPLFAVRAAPVQASWLGYCATTGMSAIDFLLADKATLPADLESQFVERIWRLPETYLCFTPPGDLPTVSPLPAKENGYVTFGSFNNLVKVNYRVIALWAKILLSVPDSKLLLKAAQLAVPSVRQNIQKAFSAHGVSSDQLLLEATLTRREDHLAAYSRVDIGLDPFPYNGVTTTAEALWMGVPVLTMLGDRFVARQGVGMLTHVKLEGWIAANDTEYVERAMRFASDLEQLAAVRTGLRDTMQRSSLVNAPAFARHWMDAVGGMWNARKPVR